MPDGRVWKVMRDSSIPGPDDEKTEVVSPICCWEEIETCLLYTSLVQRDDVHHKHRVLLILRRHAAVQLSLIHI